MRLARWQSEHSGLRVTWLDVPGPLANAYCTLATEILDDVRAGPALRGADGADWPTAHARAVRVSGCKSG